MAKLARKTQKIFASGSAQNQVTSFGSIKAGAANYTKDVNDIQTAAFEGGWSDAVQDDYAPYRQDRNGVDYVTTSQLAYVFQEGVPEYDANTTYYKGSWVKGLDGDSLVIYESLKDDNIGNNLTDEESWEAKSFGGGLEIGDIGIAPLGIDESQNKRRYLNGQVISQAQFASFTAKLKKAVELYPSLATTEADWQTIVTGSKGQQCGKFVIDDAAGTIRLPKVKDISGLQNLSNLGTIMNQSAPNITGSATFITGGNGHLYMSATGAFRTSEDISGNQATSTSGGSKMRASVIMDASRYDSTYGANGTILHQEAVQYPYFIQVATGVEESVDVSKEIQLNNPFFLGMSQYFENEPNNLSWLKSDGEYKSGTTYVSIYNFILKNVNDGVEGFKGKKGYAFESAEKWVFWISAETPKVGMIVYGVFNDIMVPNGTIQTINPNGSFIYYSIGNTKEVTCSRNATYDKTDSSWITDYDFVLNTSNTTFRLPLLNGSEDLPGNTSISLEAGTASTQTQRNITQNGFLYIHGTASTTSNAFVEIKNNTNNSQEFGTGDGLVGCGMVASMFVTPGQEVYTNYVNTKNIWVRFVPAKGNGSLYFYIGETVQDANIIATSNVFTDLANFKAEVNSRIVDIMNSLDTSHSGWARLNGLLIQWGDMGSNANVTLHQPYKDLNYYVGVTPRGGKRSEFFPADFDTYKISTTSFWTQVTTSSINITGLCWLTIGY